MPGRLAPCPGREFALEQGRCALRRPVWRASRGRPGRAPRPGTWHTSSSGEPHRAMPKLIVNGHPRTLPENATVADLVRALGLEGKRIAVEVNGDVVPRSRHEATPLRDGDAVEIVGAVGGG